MNRDRFEVNYSEKIISIGSLVLAICACLTYALVKVSIFYRYLNLLIDFERLWIHQSILKCSEQWQIILKGRKITCIKKCVMNLDLVELMENNLHVE